NGSRGEEVVLLQDALKLLNINVGTSDGQFGPKTEAGIKELQTRQPGLEINGIYDEATRNLLESLLQQ
ncbi:MAG TPA: peptidoglycan-binding domain-containing protein, partial [Prolixibacteraceae bacterium]|nr:peptidoglycan-binding domain-containing protein [Prolixibacteraceae bacterium]